MKKELRITKERTPKEMLCGIGACPAIFETSRGSYAIIGKNAQCQSTRYFKESWKR